MRFIFLRVWVSLAGACPRHYASPKPAVDHECSGGACPRQVLISNPADHYMYGSCNRLEKATHNRAKIQELTGFDITRKSASVRDEKEWKKR